MHRQDRIEIKRLAVLDYISNLYKKIEKRDFDKDWLLQELILDQIFYRSRLDL